MSGRVCGSEMSIAYSFEWLQHVEKELPVLLVILGDLEFVSTVTIDCFILLPFFQRTIIRVGRNGINHAEVWMIIHQPLLTGDLEVYKDA